MSPKNEIQLNSFIAPPHPGWLIKHKFLNTLGLTVTEAARRMGVNRITLSEIVNERKPITVRVAVLLEQLSPHPKAQVWLKMQAEYDVYYMKRSLKQAGATARRSNRAKI